MCDNQQQHRQVLMFKHCLNQKQIFCFDLPKKCPICNELLIDETENIDERRSSINDDTKVRSICEVKFWPSPLKPAKKSRCSLAIKPTKGTFLSDYKNSSDLHICLTSSEGKIVEFDENGCRITEDNTEWQSSLIIKVFENHLSKQISQLWDERLEQFITSERWKKSAYQPIENNCFDFVLEFLRSLEIPNLQEATENKTKFCEIFIVPRTKLLARYISLFRVIQRENFVILKMNE